MKWIEKNGVRYLIFQSFEQTGLVRHCFTTRIGGVSNGYFAQMNMSFGRGDAQENVMENFARLASALGIQKESMVFSHQTHGVDLYHPNEKDKGKGITQKSDIQSKDGLLTNLPGINMVTFYADCVPLFFLDPVQKVAGASHSGWKGTVMEIGAKTIKEMEMRYGCEAKNILAGIGPSIGPCCFEVDSPVALEFFDKLPWSENYIVKKEAKYLIDLWGINRQILINSGVLTENIETAELCTKCDGENFYSHRRMGAERGSMAAVIGLIGSEEA